MSALHDLTVAQLAAKLRAREISAVETAKYFLGRAQANASLCTFVAIDEEVTLRQAAAADVRLAQGTGGILAGVPVAHKDIFVTKDFPSTAGSRMLLGYRSPFDSTVVSNLASQGGRPGRHRDLPRQKRVLQHALARSSDLLLLNASERF